MPADVGNQTVTILFYAAANSLIVNKRFQEIRQTGIYSGGYLTLVDTSHAQISTLVCEISDGTYQVRVETASTVNLVVALATPYIVLRWTYTGAVSDYMELLAVATPAANDLIVGKCTFVGGNLNGFDYQNSSYPRSTPNTQDLFLKVEPTEATERRVRVRAGRIQTNSAVIDVADQKSDLFITVTSNSRIDLVYIDRSTGAVKIKKGTNAASPSAPDYDGQLVLAEVTLTVGYTNITASMIKDVRNFLSPNVSPDSSTIEFRSNGTFRVKESYILGLIPPPDLATIDLNPSGKLRVIADYILGLIPSFGAWTDKDSSNNSLVLTSVYKATSDGFVIAYGYSHGGPVYGYTSSANPPVTERCREDSGMPNKGTLTMPVRKNDYWRVISASSTKIHWLPVGSGQCVKQ